MTRTIQYRVKANRNVEAERILLTFLRNLRMIEPGTDYRAFQHADGNTYTLFASFVDHEAEYQHRNANYTERFESSLYPLCEWGPHTETLTCLA
ncbi:MAG: hypothetical protein KY459_16455 [Acidobacteria bacterium]|nr:hypothetical protein [Acidobacteriota bacterium]